MGTLANLGTTLKMFLELLGEMNGKLGRIERLLENAERRDLENAKNNYTTTCTGGCGCAEEWREAA